MDTEETSRLCKELRELNDGGPICFGKRVWAQEGSQETIVEYDGFALRLKTRDCRFVQGDSLDQVVQSTKEAIQEMKRREQL